LPELSWHCACYVVLVSISNCFIINFNLIGGLSVGNLVNAALTAKAMKVLQFSQNQVQDNLLMMAFPLFITNLTATLLIGYKTW